jgi:hypothetical protein
LPRRHPPPWTPPQTPRPRPSILDLSYLRQATVPAPQPFGRGRIVPSPLDRPRQSPPPALAGRHRDGRLCTVRPLARQHIIAAHRHGAVLPSHGRPRLFESLHNRPRLSHPQCRLRRPHINPKAQRPPERLLFAVASSHRKSPPLSKLDRLPSFPHLPARSEQSPGTDSYHGLQIRGRYRGPADSADTATPADSAGPTEPAGAGSPNDNTEKRCGKGRTGASHSRTDNYSWIYR